MIYAVIPARGGSKGVPRKNLRSVSGVPLIAYSIKAALKTPSIERTIVSTDSPEIADVAKNLGADVPFFRPEEISQDRSTDYEFVAHMLEWLQNNEGKIPSQIVHLRPTTPLRDPE